MKRFFFLTSSIIVTLVAVSVISTQHFYHDSNDTNESDLLLLSIEALSREETGPSNTGPREEKKCAGGGHKMVCLCINDNPCTDSSCY